MYSIVIFILQFEHTARDWLCHLVAIDYLLLLLILLTRLLILCTRYLQRRNITYLSCVKRLVDRFDGLSVAMCACACVLFLFFFWQRVCVPSTIYTTRWSTTIGHAFSVLLLTFELASIWESFHSLLVFLYFLHLLSFPPPSLSVFFSLISSLSLERKRMWRRGLWEWEEPPSAFIPEE